MPVTFSLPLLALALSTTPVTQAASFPGGERDAAEATLQITAASGTYSFVKEAKVTQLVSDGSGDTRAAVSSFLVELDGEPHRFEPTVTHRSDCGDIYIAREQGTAEDGTLSTLVLRDYRHGTCREKPATPWMVDLRLEQRGQTSLLQADGVPEPLLL